MLNTAWKLSVLFFCTAGALVALAATPFDLLPSLAKANSSLALPPLPPSDLVAFPFFDLQIGSDEEFEEDEEESGVCRVDVELEPVEQEEQEGVEEVEQQQREDVTPSDWTRPSADEVCAPHVKTLVVARRACRDKVEFSSKKSCSKRISQLLETHDDAQLCSLFAERITAAGFHLQQHVTLHADDEYLPVDFSSLSQSHLLPLHGLFLGTYHLAYDRGSYDGLSTTARNYRRLDPAGRAFLQSILPTLGYADVDIEALSISRTYQGLHRRLLCDHLQPATIQSRTSLHYKRVSKHQLVLRSFHQTFSPIFPAPSSSSSSSASPEIELPELELALTGLWEHLRIVHSRSFVNAGYLKFYLSQFPDEVDVFKPQELALNLEVGLEPPQYEPKALLYLTVGRKRTLRSKKVGRRYSFPGGETHLLYDTTIRLPVHFSNLVPEPSEAGLAYEPRVFVSFDESSARVLHDELIERNKPGTHPWTEFRPVLPPQHPNEYVIVLVVLCVGADTDQADLFATSIHFEDDEPQDPERWSLEEVTRFRAWLFAKFYASSQSLARGDEEAKAAHAKVLVEGDGEGEEE